MTLRRPALTRKRAEGLGELASLIDQLLYAADELKPGSAGRAALDYIRDLRTWDKTKRGERAAAAELHGVRYFERPIPSVDEQVAAGGGGS